MDYPPYIMLGGTGRSGTNILKAVFSKHPDVLALPFEHRILIDPDGIVDYYNACESGWSPFAVDVRMRRLNKFLLSKAHARHPGHVLGSIVKILEPSGRTITSWPYHGWELESWFPGYEKRVKELMVSLEEFKYSGRWPGAPAFTMNYQLSFARPFSRGAIRPIFQRFVNDITRSALASKNKSFFVEDNTWNILFADTLQEIIPQSTLIHIYRDPRDVVASFTKQNWCPDELKRAILWYLGIWERWKNVERHLENGFCLMVKFESLVSDTKDTISEVCKFTELPLHNDMTTPDLSRHNIGRWKREFNERDREILNSRLAPILGELGYS